MHLLYHEGFLIAENYSEACTLLADLLILKYGPVDIRYSAGLTEFPHVVDHADDIAVA